MDNGRIQKAREEICTIWRVFVKKRQSAICEDEENKYIGLQGMCQDVLDVINELSNKIMQMEDMCE